MQHNATAGTPFHPFVLVSSHALIRWSPLDAGCGLPAGPFGLLGATEGLSYLAVLGLVGYQLLRLANNDSKKQSSLLEAIPNDSHKTEAF